MKFLCEKNNEVFRKNGKNFGELITHFITGEDDSYFIIDANYDGKVVGKYRNR